ncbi:MAG TPA: hypothetical protein PKW63_15445 [Vicinamibacterales bacterium]|jgi:hypothetical protein|nr:hypothetical protein [Vicinamibacterales bacterium]
MADTRVTCISAQGAEHELAFTALATPDLADRARTETNAWIKRLRLVLYGGVSMRDRFRYRDDSLWWFTELYLQKMRQLDQAVLTVLALDHARAQHAPARLVVTAADAATIAAARAFGAARGVPIDVRGGASAPPRLYWPGAKVGVTAALSRARRTVSQTAGRLRGSRPAPPTPGAIAAFVHTAFWRAGEDADGGTEGYIGPVLDAITAAAPDALRLVGVGPKRNFTTRRWWDPITTAPTSDTITPVEDLAPWSALSGSLALWRDRSALADEVVGGEGIRAAALVYGCDLWPVLKHELRGAALVQWPWSARAMDEAGAAIDALECHTVVTYAEAGGWGRALVLEARRRGVASVGLQHGFIYRHWLNYLHEPDEMLAAGADRGFPLPDKTLLFNSYAEAHLRSAGAFPADRLEVTGSPGLDALVTRMATFSDADRAAMRALTGSTGAGQKLAVLVAKFTEVRDALPALADLMRQKPEMRLAIKAHPAETGDVYAPYFSGLGNVTILAADTDLSRVLSVADAVLTRNSTVAIDALVLGLPALVLGRPSNLSPFVDEGVMAGVDAADNAIGIGETLERLLYDREVRATVTAAADAFVARYGLRPKQGSAARAADVILEMARR